MTFTFTGTGTSQGVPVIGCECRVCTSKDPRDNRLRCSAVIQTDDTAISFDAGPDFRQQMLQNHIKKLHAIVFTHNHKDHTAGLDDVRAYNYQMKAPMHVYANEATIEHLKKEYYYIFDHPDYPGIPQIKLIKIDKESFSIGEIHLLPIPVLHGRIEVLGFRVGDFAYITDANKIPLASRKKLEGIHTLVLNALRIRPHHSHFSLEEAIEVARSLEVSNAYFTHISHLMGQHKEIQALLPDGYYLAEDRLQLDISI